MTNKYLDYIYTNRYRNIDCREAFMGYVKTQGKKNKNAIKIVAYAGALGSAYWRLFAPLMELVKDEMFDARITTILYKEDLEWADILWFQRCANLDTILEARKAKKDGKVIIYDTDDYLHGLPDYHPNKKFIESSMQLLGMDELCNMSDLITMSTPYLKQLYEKKYKTPIIVFPNCLRVEDWDNLGSHSLDTINIGWGGGVEHYEDLKLIVPDIKKLLEKEKNYRLVMVNFPGVIYQPKYQDCLEGIPMNKRICFYGTMPHQVSNYYHFLDVGLAPLIDNDFNRSKSNIKYLEYSMAGIPTVASDLTPYQGEGIISVTSKGSWGEAIEQALNLHPITADQRREAVIKKYSIENNIKLWKDTFWDLCNG